MSLCPELRVHIKNSEIFNLLLLQEAIANAKSLDEVQQLEAMLKAGQIPGDVVTSNHHGGTHSQARGGGYEMEEEEVEG